MANRKIQLGIIGLSADQQAWATMTHVVPLEGEPLNRYYDIKTIGTSSPEPAKAAAKAFGVPEEKAYSKPVDMANDKDVDMVVVSVKVPLHHQLTLPALQAKKDVFVEWPLGAISDPGRGAHSSCPETRRQEHRWIAGKTASSGSKSMSLCWTLLRNSQLIDYRPKRSSNLANLAA